MTGPHRRGERIRRQRRDRQVVPLQGEFGVGDQEVKIAASIGS